MIKCLLLGFMMAYLGLLPPGMLNMTTVRIRLQKGRIPSYLFALGAGMVVFFHAGVAFIAAEYLQQSPEILRILKYLAIPIFLALSFFFYRKSKTQNSIQAKNVDRPFWQGLAMSSLNMLGLPFYFGISTYLASNEMVELVVPNVYYLTIGAVIGATCLFLTYATIAELIDSKFGFIAKNINRILSLLFIFLACLVVIQLLFS